MIVFAREWLHRYTQLTNQSSSFPAWWPSTGRLLAAAYLSVSWIGVVLFWWLGASVLGPELVVKPASSGGCQGHRNPWSVWQSNRSPVLL